MSTTEILRGYGRKLSAVALALGLLAAPRAVAVGLPGRAATPDARAKRAAATTLAKAKKHKKKPDAAPSADAADSADDGGEAGEDKEAAVLAPKKAARSDDDDGASAAPRKKSARYVEDGAGSSTASADDEAGHGDKPKVVKLAPAPLREEESAEAPAPAGTALEIGFGGMALFRNLVWTSDAAAAKLGPYSLTPGPEAGLWLEFYPAAFVTSGFASNIGLYARYAYGFGVTSTLQSGTNAATSYQDFVAGLKVRLPLGTFTPYGTLSYGEQQFSLAPEGTATDLPAMDYSFVRIGLGTRIQFSPIVGLDVGAAFLSVTNAGSGLNQLASPSYFPQTTAYAIEAGTSLAIRLGSKLGARLGADFRQYGMAFNPQAGAARQVTGAVDRYIVAWSGLEVLIDGFGTSSTADPAATPRTKHRSSDDDSSDPDSKPDEEKPSNSSKSSDDE